MIKTVIKTCSCFIDKSVWFVNLSQKRAVNPWRFDCFEPERRIVDIISNKFIKDIRTTKILVDEKTCLKNTIVILCVDCFEFQLMLISLQENSMLDTLNCRFVTYDFPLLTMIIVVIYLLEIISLSLRIISICMNKGNCYLEIVMLN